MMTKDMLESKMKSPNFGIAYMAQSHLEALAEIEALKGKVERLAVEKETLRKVSFEQISQRKYGIPYYGLSREQLMDVDGDFEQALKELEG
jgi:hypothetical protein